MRKVKFGLSSLKDLKDGVIDRAFQHEVAAIVKDCEDRSKLAKDRVLTLKFKFAPKVDGDGDSTGEVIVTAELTRSMPKRQSEAYTMIVQSDGTLTFHPELPDEPDGSTLYDGDAVDHETGEVK